MSEQPIRKPRQVGIADHIWETYTQMAYEMGTDRDGLINQALFGFARQNGYLGRPPEAAPAPTPSPAPAPAPAPAPTPAAVAPYVAPFAAPREEPRFEPPAFEKEPPPAAPPLRPSRPAGPPPPPPPTAAIPMPVIPPPAPAAAFAAPPVPPPAPYVPSATAPDLGTKMSADEVRAAQERVLQKADELARLVRGSSEPEVSDDEDAEGTPEPARAAGPMLVLYAEGREVERVAGPRFLIGRGKHCDLIINSGKVSREHAAIVRDGDGYFIEDLGSSNGTWFEKKRITRRRIEDGDEYFVCSEKLTCRLE